MTNQTKPTRALNSVVNLMLDHIDAKTDLFNDPKYKKLATKLTDWDIGYLCATVNAVKKLCPQD